MGTYGAPAAPPAHVKPPGPSLRLSIIVIVVGALIAVPSLVAGLVPIFRVFDSTHRFEVPGSAQLQLGKGNYLVYEDVGSAGPFNIDSGGGTLAPSDVTVTDVSGNTLPTRSPGVVNQSITTGGRRYEGLVEFTTPRAGQYTVAIGGGSPDSVIVARPFIDALESGLGWFLLCGVGGIVFVTGVVLLVVGAVRRSRAQQAYAYVPAQAPPGWYADALGSGRLRYWDGTRWTEHLH